MGLLNPLLESLTDTLMETMTREQAEAIVAMRADEATQARIDNYADKANFGTLTTKERSEYDEFLSFYRLISTLQLRARLKLKER